MKDRLFIAYDFPGIAINNLIIVARIRFDVFVAFWQRVKTAGDVSETASGVIPIVLKDDVLFVLQSPITSGQSIASTSARMKPTRSGNSTSAWSHLRIASMQFPQAVISCVGMIAERSVISGISKDGTRRSALSRTQSRYSRQRWQISSRASICNPIQ